MRRFLALCGGLLFFSLAAGAQENSVAASLVTAAAPSPQYLSEAFNWQVALSYQYVHFREAPGTTLHLHGLNTSFTRFTNSWFGLEASAAPAFGSSPAAGERAKFVWYGGGPRLVARSSAKFEPWVHGLVGGAHVLPQTNLGGQNAFGVVAGGGVDIKLNPRVYWRVQGDYLWTHFFSTTQNSFQLHSGVVFNF